MTIEEKETIHDLYQLECFNWQERQKGKKENVQMIEEILEKEYQKLPKNDPLTTANYMAFTYLQKDSGPTETKIIHQQEDNLPAKRMLLQYLKKNLTQENILSLPSKVFNTAFQNFEKENYIPVFLFTEKHFANMSYVLDHAELFLGMLTDEKRMISPSFYQKIKDSFLYLYPELEKEEKRYSFTTQNGILLASRYHGFNLMVENDFLKENGEVMLMKEAFEAAIDEVLRWENKYHTEEEGKQKWNVTSIYLDSFLKPLSLTQTYKVHQKYQEHLYHFHKEGGFRKEPNFSQQRIDWLFQKNFQEKKSLTYHI
ncbi:MAG TPA: hypothetical protein IAC24_02150 [Candidatus Onthousia faecigallinarum]|nr:hypothetical protein [Candidatus Onthousia faecigallinarum]